ncbi:MAG: hypothetical protein LBQ41_03890 [Candidatus Ancillula sp.]|jgi:hypothetical protein|nr:hypothetical protein [Candidatus Ancillula sp.]
MDKYTILFEGNLALRVVLFFGVAYCIIPALRCISQVRLSETIQVCRAQKILHLVLLPPVLGLSVMVLGLFLRPLQFYLVAAFSVAWLICTFSLLLKFRRQAFVNFFKFDITERVVVAVSVLFGLVLVAICNTAPDFNTEQFWLEGSDSPLIYNKIHLFGAYGSMHFINGLVYGIFSLPLNFVYNLLLSLGVTFPISHAVVTFFIAQFTQVLVNSLMCLLLFRILQHFFTKSLSTVIILGLVFSHLMYPLSVAPETYSASVFLTLAALYFYVSSYSTASVIIAYLFAGFSNPFCFAILLPIIAPILKKYIKYLQFLTKTRRMLLYVVFCLFLLTFAVISYFWVMSYANINVSLNYVLENLDMCFSYVFFGGMSSTALRLTLVTLVLAIVCCASVKYLVPILYKRGQLQTQNRNVLLQCSVSALFFGTILAGLIGYGGPEKMLYSPLFSVFFYVLLATSIRTLCRDSRAVLILNSVFFLLFSVTTFLPIIVGVTL